MNYTLILKRFICLLGSEKAHGASRAGAALGSGSRTGKWGTGKRPPRLRVGRRNPRTAGTVESCA